MTASPSRRALLRGIGCLTALAIAPSLAAAATARTKKKKSKKKVAEPPPPQPAVKRQNFRARRPEEIPPWEGFEDCPFGLPCVGGARRPK